MHVTQQQLARQLGISQMAVSYALNGKPGVNPQTRRRVLDAAQRLGYRRNVAGRAMRTGRFGAAALLLPPGAGGYLPPGLVRGLMHRLDEQDMHLTVAELPDHKLSDAGYVPKMLRELAVDGLLIDYLGPIPERMLELIEAFNVPSVWINRRTGHDAVHPDDFGGTQKAVEHLLSLGHRRITYVQPARDPDKSHYSWSDRRTGYASAMVDAGLTPDVVDLPHADLASLTRRVAGEGRSTAVLTYGPEQATAVVVAAAAAGIDVPGDLSLVTFANYPPTIVKRISTMMIHQANLGRLTADMLVRKIESPGKPIATEAVPLRLKLAETVAPPRAA